MVRVPSAFSASPRPMVVVVLPSPAAVGLMPVTRTRRPCGRVAWAVTKAGSIFALYLPKGISASSGMPARAAMAPMGCRVAARAISRSVAIR